jgi:hypothetical protein
MGFPFRPAAAHVCQGTVCQGTVCQGTVPDLAPGSGAPKCQGTVCQGTVSDLAPGSGAPKCQWPALPCQRGHDQYAQ